MNEKYGLSKSYHHDLNEDGVCKKCHKAVNELKLKLCSVIGVEELAQSTRNAENDWNWK